MSCLAVVLSHCGSGVTGNGSVHGRSFVAKSGGAVVHKLTGNPGPDGVLWDLQASNTDGVCNALAHPSPQRTDTQLIDIDLLTFPALRIGDYPISLPSQAPRETFPVVTAVYAEPDYHSHMNLIIDADTGRATITAVDDSHIAGTATLSFGEEHVILNFDLPVCRTD